jgi:hypothetical protein
VTQSRILGAFPLAREGRKSPNQRESDSVLIHAANTETIAAAGISFSSLSLGVALAGLIVSAKVRGGARQHFVFRAEYRLGALDSRNRVPAR